MKTKKKKPPAPRDDQRPGQCNEVQISTDVRPNLTYVVVTCPPKEHWCRVEAFFFACTGKMPDWSLGGDKYVFEDYLTHDQARLLEEYIEELKKV